MLHHHHIFWCIQNYTVILAFSSAQNTQAEWLFFQVIHVAFWVFHQQYQSWFDFHQAWWQKVVIKIKLWNCGYPENKVKKCQRNKWPFFVALRILLSKSVPSPLFLFKFKKKKQLLYMFPHIWDQTVYQKLNSWVNSLDKQFFFINNKSSEFRSDRINVKFGSTRSSPTRPHLDPGSESAYRSSGRVFVPS